MPHSFNPIIGTNPWFQKLGLKKCKAMTDVRLIGMRKNCIEDYEMYDKHIGSKQKTLYSAKDEVCKTKLYIKGKSETNINEVNTSDYTGATYFKRNCREESKNENNYLEQKFHQIRNLNTDIYSPWKYKKYWKRSFSSSDLTASAKKDLFRVKSESDVYDSPLGQFSRFKKVSEFNDAQDLTIHTNSLTPHDMNLSNCLGNMKIFVSICDLNSID